MTSRYVLSLRNTGLGDRLICLCAAWKFARDTRRKIIVDWRRSIYSSDSSNLFPACFESALDLAGVPLLASESVETSFLPRPFYPLEWDRTDLIETPWHAPTDGFPGERDRAVALIRSGADVEAPTVVFSACVNDGIVSYQDARSCLEALRPIPSITETVNAYYDTHLRAGPWIGLHVRHGNGGAIMNHAPYWESFPAAIERCKRTVEMARVRIGSDAKVLLCTDSIVVEMVLRSVIPGVICRPKSFRVFGQGELHLGPDAAAGLNDALAEMLLLARCTALIRYPPGSFFSFYAAVMKLSTNLPPATVYDLQKPCDPDDRLAPTLLF